LVLPVPPYCGAEKKKNDKKEAKTAEGLAKKPLVCRREGPERPDDGGGNKDHKGGRDEEGPRAPKKKYYLMDDSRRGSDIAASMRRRGLYFA
jgi:hypothetical protein